MTKRSFESINYSLRPNKNVERKLIVATLQRMRGEFPVSDYRYVGFGSMWFTDFILMHKMLGIVDMITIESQTSRQKRVEFNKPFACIRPIINDAAAVLGEVIDDKPSIVWLDYDGPLKNAMDGGLETAIGVMSSGSMIMISVNAVVDQLRGHQRDDKTDVDPAEYLADICDNPDLVNLSNLLTRNDFPKLVGDLLHARLKSAVLTKKPECNYVPIWSFQYADDADIVTVGGMIANVIDRAKLDRCNLPVFGDGSSKGLFRIDLPVLTEKEKRALDKLLPSAKALEPKDLDFELRPSEVEAYQKFYLHYPVFNEMAT